MRTARAAAALVFAASGLLASAQSDDSSSFSSFVYPVPGGDSETYHFMDTVMVEYISNFASVTLWTFCKPGVGETQFIQKAPGFNATVPVVLNLTSATPCWFNIRSPDEKYGANSQTFNVIGQERKGGRRTFGAGNPPSAQSSSSPSSSSPTPTPTPTPSSSLVTTSSGSLSSTSQPSTTQTDDSVPGPNETGESTSTTTLARATGIPQPDSTETPSPGLSAGASAGIAVGATVLVLSLGAGAFFWFWTRKRRGEKIPVEGQQQPPIGPYGHGDVYAKVEAPPNYASSVPAGYHHSYQQQQYAQHQFGGELGAANAPREMAGADVWPANRSGRRAHEMAG
ncbi:hypothetical protein QBC41DRAFT_329271 [Cercophora samala]|uniref:Uncharacterized protein n=1 Tax=Cercophora samala TaxID=330535 RepID=A0AA39Z3D0_9PEZI|nr:hypothetical protein QBC41DRAFT_329271 [Cercophora samala]